MTKQTAKVVRLLGSDHDGEALAAVRKLGGLLKENNKDWHWLAALVEANLSAKPVSPIDAAINAYGAASANWRPAPRSQPKEDFDLDERLCTVTVHIVGQSPKAWKVRRPNGRIEWPAKSKASVNNVFHSDGKQMAEMTMPKWVAAKHGFLVDQQMQDDEQWEDWTR